MLMLNIIRLRKVWYAISGVLIVASLAAVGVWGLRLGIDFTGGSLLQVDFPNGRPTVQQLEERLADAGVGTVLVQPLGEREANLRFQSTDDASRKKVLETLRGEDAASVTELSYQTVGPAVGSELRSRSLRAILLVVLAIVAYIAFVFRHVSKPVASWKYGLVAIVALIHDVLIPTGVFAVLGRFAGVEVDVLFVTALLTVLGFSVHDTIVVFDRVRENLRRRAGMPFEEIVSVSVKETLVRSINTSLTTVLVLAAVYFFGGASTRPFVLALIIGITAGTYSSIFIASPLLVTWQRLSQRR